MPQQLSDLFKAKDINKDGGINFDGFKAAILSAGDIQDYSLKMDELKEIFNLLAKKKSFAYAEFVIEQDADNRVYFSDVKNLPSIEDSINASSILDKSGISEKRPGELLTRAPSLTPGLTGMGAQKPNALIVAR